MAHYTQVFTTPTPDETRIVIVTNGGDTMEINRLPEEELSRIMVKYVVDDSETTPITRALMGLLPDIEKILHPLPVRTNLWTLKGASAFSSTPPPSPTGYVLPQLFMVFDVMDISEWTAQRAVGLLDHISTLAWVSAFGAAFSGITHNCEFGRINNKLVVTLHTPLSVHVLTGKRVGPLGSKRIDSWWRTPIYDGEVRR